MCLGNIKRLFRAPKLPDIQLPTAPTPPPPPATIVTQQGGSEAKDKGAKRRRTSTLRKRVAASGRQSQIGTSIRGLLD